MWTSRQDGSKVERENVIILRWQTTLTIKYYTICSLCGYVVGCVAVWLLR